MLYLNLFLDVYIGSHFIVVLNKAGEHQIPDFTPTERILSNFWRSVKKKRECLSLCFLLLKTIKF